MSDIKSPPALNIPASSSIVSVSLIDTTATIIAPTSVVVAPHISGHDFFKTPCFAFLLVNNATGERVIFDLGIRKDIENLSPVCRGLTAKMTSLTIEKNVADILGPEEVTRVSAIIWSHHHFDHIGDPSTFPKSTRLVVGTGFKAEFLPGYPARQDSWILEKDYEGRELREIDVASSSLIIGQYSAHDYFEDGSLYLLDCPGHTIGHMMALARTTPDTFVLLAADCCHHGGEFRPTKYVPLPDQLNPNPLQNNQSYPRNRPCPGSLFQRIHPTRSRVNPFYTLNNPNDLPQIHEAIRSQRKLDEFDAHENVLVLMAHDADAKGVVDLWPRVINDWKVRGWKDKLRWAFLNDFRIEQTL